MKNLNSFSLKFRERPSPLLSNTKPMANSLKFRERPSPLLSNTKPMAKPSAAAKTQNQSTSNLVESADLTKKM